MADAPHPALALLELDSVTAGIRAADAMVKRAPIATVKAGTVHPGHYLILVAGSVAAVEEAADAGVTTAGAWLIDHVMLPDVHPQVSAAALGEHRPIEAEALGIVESRSVASLLRAADAAVKATDITLTRIRMADDLGGRAFLLAAGPLADVEAALDLCASRIPEQARLNAGLIPRLDATIRSVLDAGSRFSECDHFQPEGAEIHAAG